MPTPLEMVTTALRAPPVPLQGSGGAGASALRAKPKFSAMPVGKPSGKRRIDSGSTDPGRPQALLLWGML
eukprot:2145356-Alexandrium_andersonii.AAC.1